MSVGWFLTALPWMPAAMVVVIVVATLLSPAVGRRIGAPMAHALLLLVSAGFVVAATIPPDGSTAPRTPGLACDLSRAWLASWRTYTNLNQSSLNVLLFVPLGVAIAVLPRTPARRWIVGSAIAAPIVIELLQFALPALARGCQSADVVDNLLGLGVGVAAGSIIRRVMRRVTSQRPGS